MSNECIPFYGDARGVTVVAGAGGVSGKRFVTTTGSLAAGLGTNGGVPTGVLPAAGAAVMGVGFQDAAAGISVGVYTHGIVPVTCSAALTAGTQVATDATGQAVPWTTGDVVAGTCLATAASGSDAQIELAQ